MLSKKQILKISNKKAKAFDIPLEESNVFYDVERKKWQETIDMMEEYAPDFSKQFKILNGRDYVIVLYKHKDPGMIGGGLWLFIDRKTGEIITYLPEI